MSQVASTDNCEGITLSKCGIIFLATPHTGSGAADWNDFLVAVANTVAGVRPEIVNILKSFNTYSVWDKKAFFDLNPQPPFRCFAEARKMVVRSTRKHVRAPGSILMRTTIDLITL